VRLKKQRWRENKDKGINGKRDILRNTKEKWQTKKKMKHTKPQRMRKEKERK